MRAAHYETSEFGYEALEVYTQDTDNLLGPLPTSEGDTVVLVNENALGEIDNMSHIVGVSYLYDQPA